MRSSADAPRLGLDGHIIPVVVLERPTERVPNQGDTLVHRPRRLSGTMSLRSVESTVRQLAHRVEVPTGMNQEQCPSPMSATQ